MMSEAGDGKQNWNKKDECYLKKSGQANDECDNHHRPGHILFAEDADERVGNLIRSA